MEWARKVIKLLNEEVKWVKTEWAEEAHQFSCIINDVEIIEVETREKWKMLCNLLLPSHLICHLASLTTKLNFAQNKIDRAKCEDFWHFKPRQLFIK